MTIKLKNNTFVNVGTGISAPESAHIEADGNKGFNVGKMFDIRKDKKTLHWFEKPLGMIILGIIIAVIGAGIIFYLGWN